MPKIIAVLNQKGGTGKTTLATNLAVAGARRGLRVLLVDSDRQGSARDWHAAGDGCGVQIVAADTPSSAASLPNLASNYDLVLVDGAPSAGPMAAAVLKVADFVLIPVQPSPYDIWAAGELVELVQARKAVNEALGTAFVVSRAIPRSGLAADVVAALEGHGLPVLAARTHQRVSYPNSVGRGKSVFDSDDAAARSEIESIFEEIMR